MTRSRSIRPGEPAVLKLSGGHLPVAPGSFPLVRAALAAAWLAVSRRPDIVVAQAEGGRAGLIPFMPVVTVLDGSPRRPASRVEAWLEGRQARRSRLIYAADRDTAVAYALIWGLDPTRFRLASAEGPSSREIGRDLRFGLPRRRSWHSA